MEAAMSWQFPEDGDVVTRQKDVECAFCPKSVRLHVRVWHTQLAKGPWYLERGYLQPASHGEFREGCCLTLAIQSRGIEIFYAASIVTLPGWFSVPSWAEGGEKIPEFGLGDQRVFWVCAHCADLCDRDPEKIHSALLKKANLHLRGEMCAHDDREKLAARQGILNLG